MVRENQDIGTDETEEPYYQGDSLAIVITVDKDGSEKNLSGDVVYWSLKMKNEGEVLDESSNGVIVEVTDPNNGEITIKLNAGVTDGMWGSGSHIVRIEDTDGSRTDKAVVASGDVYIRDR